MKTLSIILPVYNEEQLLEKEVASIIYKMANFIHDVDYEILIIENGSTDNTTRILNEVRKKYPQIKIVNLPESDYGQAIKIGIVEACGRYLAIFNIDFWDIDFLKEALNDLTIEEIDLVVGSKVMEGAQESRPYLRKYITRGWNITLKILFGFKGTDTHGMKVINKEKFIPLVKKCVTARWLFDTELILRAQRTGLKIKELPVSCREKRKSPTSILRRGPSVLADLIKLYYYLNLVNSGK